MLMIITVKSKALSIRSKANFEGKGSEMICAVRRLVLEWLKESFQPFPQLYDSLINTCLAPQFT